MTVVTADKRGRIQLPCEVQEAWHLRTKQSSVEELHGDSVAVTRVKEFQSQSDPLLKEFTDHPLKGGKLNRKILDEIEDTMWLP